jgi:hypothetical protein
VSEARTNTGAKKPESRIFRRRKTSLACVSSGARNLEWRIPGACARDAAVATRGAASRSRTRMMTARAVSSASAIRRARELFVAG